MVVLGLVENSNETSHQIVGLILRFGDELVSFAMLTEEEHCIPCQDGNCASQWRCIWPIIGPVDDISPRNPSLSQPKVGLYGTPP